MRCWKNARRSSRAPEFAIVAALLLAACGEPATAPPLDPATEPVVLPPIQEPAATPVEPAAPAPAVLGWSHESSGEGNALVLREDNADVVRIACVRGKGLVVHGDGFKHVESEERMSVGAGNTVVTLVATAAGDGDGVKGEGPIDPDFIRAVTEGRKIAVNYGYQNIGPFNGPPAEVAAAFAAGCGSGGG